MVVGSVLIPLSSSSWYARSRFEKGCKTRESTCVLRRFVAKFASKAWHCAPLQEHHLSCTSTSPMHSKRAQHVSICRKWFYLCNIFNKQSFLLLCCFILVACLSTIFACCVRRCLRSFSYLFASASRFSEKAWTFRSRLSFDTLHSTTQRTSCWIVWTCSY